MDTIVFCRKNNDGYFNVINYRILTFNTLDLFWFPLAEVKCHKYDSEINIPHLVVTPDKYEYRYNERVSLRCEAGYTLQGPSTATCLEGFNLSSPLSCLGKIFIISNLAQLISEKMRYFKKKPHMLNNSFCLPELHTWTFIFDVY